MNRARYLIGIDVGGTFTDVLAYDPQACQLRSAKVASLPGEQWRGVLDALHELGIEPADIRAFVHGTTIATNGLLERKGAVTALVTTEGFRDVLEIGKARRLIGGLFEMAWHKPEPIVPRWRRFEVPERVAADGSVLRSVEGFDAAPLAHALRESGAQTIAVSFVNSYVNASNEEVVAQALRRLLPDIPVTASAWLVSARGEFERTSTAVLNAYLTNMMSDYLDRLQDELRGRGVAAPVNIMGSNGGAMTLAEASRRVAGTFLSGPVGGVNGAVQIARMLDVKDIITLDMGGTSTDVALVHQLEPRMSYDNQVDAYPLLMPELDIHAIGAGGGSLIWVGPDGTLQIGPRSAGALPGPACYGRGGTEPTVSDANLLLGRLTGDHALSGGLRLRPDLAEQAFRRVADRLGVSDLQQLAARALQVATAKMAGAVREVSVHRGFDPRDFVLVAYGGAGPMHVFDVAHELAISEVVIPRLPGHLSALGQMLADLRHDKVRVWGGRLSQLQPVDLDEQLGEMRAEAAAQLELDGMPPARQQHAFRIDMRYCGQSFTLQVSYEPGSPWQGLRAAFEKRHEETFGYAAPDTDVEIVNLRLVSIGLADKPQLLFRPEAGGDPYKGLRPVWFDDWVDCGIYEREHMPAGYAFSGPAVVMEAGGTSVVPPGWNVRVHDSGSMVCTHPRANAD